MRAAFETRRFLAPYRRSLLCTLAALAVGAFGLFAHGDTVKSFSHDDWTTVLERFVDNDGMVDYQALAKDRKVFGRYVKRIQTTSPATQPNLFPSREERLAYYVNAYNAQVFAGVLDRGPETKSVWRGLVSGLNFFVHMKVTVGGERMSLKHLEEEIILKDFKDPRVHAALNCASIGCPRLPQHAFVPEDLDTQLDAAFTEWVADPRHVRVDAARRVVSLNKIFDWFKGDFVGYEETHGNADGTVVDFINRYRADDAKIPAGYATAFLPYDKNINSQ